MTKESENEQFHQLPKNEQHKDDEPEDRHLEAKELERLLGGSLNGEHLVAALIHLETCSECRRKLPPVEAEKLLKAVFGEEEEPPDDDSPARH